MNDVLTWTIISAVGFTLCVYALWRNYQSYQYARQVLTSGHVTVARGQVRRSLFRWIVMGIFLAAGLCSEIAPEHSAWIVKGLIAAAAILVLSEALDAFDR